jgi:Zn finger protein HypA/HybF involved in hydrogenase expression
MFQDAERTIIIIAGLIIFFVISGLLARGKKTNVATEIGSVKCKRCGHEANAKASAQFKAFKGIETKLTCERCGSEDWSKDPYAA